MNILRDFKIGTRLLVSLSFLIILLIGIAGLGYWGITSVNQSMNDASTEFKKIQIAEDLKSKVDNSTIEIGSMVLSGDPSKVKASRDKVDALRAGYQRGGKIPGNPGRG